MMVAVSEVLNLAAGWLWSTAAGVRQRQSRLAAVDSRGEKRT